MIMVTPVQNHELTTFTRVVILLALDFAGD